MTCVGLDQFIVYNDSTKTDTNCPIIQKYNMYNKYKKCTIPFT